MLDKYRNKASRLISFILNDLLVKIDETYDDIPLTRTFTVKIGIEYKDKKLHKMVLPRRKNSAYNKDPQQIKAQLFLLNSLYEVIYSNAFQIESILTTLNDTKLFPDIELKASYWRLMKSNTRQQKNALPSTKTKRRNMNLFKDAVDNRLSWQTNTKAKRANNILKVLATNINMRNDKLDKQDPIKWKTGMITEEERKQLYQRYKQPQDWESEINLA